MNLTSWLDVAIGLAVVYLGASLFVTIIGEYVLQLLNLRGRVLWDSLLHLISDATLRSKLAENPVLAPFFRPGAAGPTPSGLPASLAAFFTSPRARAPTYVDPLIVARALLGGDAAAGAAAGKAEVPKELQHLVGAVGEQTSEMVAAVSHWVESSLTSLGTQYKRYARWITLGIGLVVTISLNIDTVALTTLLYKDREARDAVVAVGLDVTSKVDQEKFNRCIGKAAVAGPKDGECLALEGLVDAVRLRNRTLAKLPIGWPPVPYGPSAAPDPSVLSEAWWAWLLRAGGWLLTALALSLGAPFWFTALGKVVNVRQGLRQLGPSREAAPEGAEPTKSAGRRQRSPG